MKFQLDTPKDLFKEHLALDNNSRIIFSGAFGTGKTYFLDKYFDNNDEYQSIHLFPVNYSVASNEDIFELIKYDIIFRLLEKEVELDMDHFQIPKSIFLPYFLNNNKIDIIVHLLGFIPKVGVSLKNGAKKLIDLKERFDQEYRDLHQSQENNIVNYLEQITNEKGGLYEGDYFTQLIVQLVNQLQEEGSITKKTVLIIDDLDRIDPEHIFRILNILAAHVDLRKDQNKFGFDHIILVCDIENIRKIFSNRYGMDVDFSGYIDKFYSRSIYQYDLSAEIINSFRDVLEFTPDLNTSQNFADNTIFILLCFLQYNLLSTRTLLRNLDSRTKIGKREIWEDNELGKKISGNEISLIDTVYYLADFFQGYEILIENCKKLIGKELKNPFKISKEMLIEELIIGVSFKSYFKNTINTTDESEDLSSDVSHLTFVYKIKRKWSSRSSDVYTYNIHKISHSNNSKININDIDYFQLLTWVLEESEFGKLIKTK